MNWFMDSDHGTLTTPVVPRLRSPRRSRVLREVISLRHGFSEDSDAVARPPVVVGPEEAGPPRLTHHRRGKALPSAAWGVDSSLSSTPSRCDLVTAD